jgi:hypothetical protein
MKSRHIQPKRARAFRCRCSKCEHRVFMERHPRTYSRGLVCESCGHRAADREDGWRVDWFRTSKAEAARQGVCHCIAMAWPHRPGSAFKNSPCDRFTRGGRRVVRIHRERVAA